MTTTLVAMMFGMIAMGCFVASLFFVRFWRTTREPLFAWFAAAFAVLGVQRVGGIVSSAWVEDSTWLYVLRLAGFLLIIVGIVAANRRPKSP